MNKKTSEVRYGCPSNHHEELKRLKGMLFPTQSLNDFCQGTMELGLQKIREALIKGSSFSLNISSIDGSRRIITEKSERGAK